MSVPNPPPSPPMPQHRRRSSFAEMFNPRGGTSNSTAISSSPPSAGVPSTPGGPQHRRGTSITALGLTTNPSNQTPFGAFGLQRRASVATSSSVASSPEFRNSFGDEPAVLEEDDPTRATLNPPASPSFARRVSFGAQALRDVRMGGSPGASGGGRRPSSSLLSTLNENSENATPSRKGTSGTAKTAEGFNWSDALRDRTKRSPSFSSGNPFNQGTARPRSISTSNPDPPKEIPKPVESPTVRMKKPDHLGERMLRGDFMMD